MLSRQLLRHCARSHQIPRRIPLSARFKSGQAASIEGDRNRSQRPARESKKGQWKRAKATAPKGGKWGGTQEDPMSQFLVQSEKRQQNRASSENTTQENRNRKPNKTRSKFKAPREENQSSKPKKKRHRSKMNEILEDLEHVSKPKTKVKVVQAQIAKKEIIVSIPKSITLRELSLRSGVGMRQLISMLIRLGGIDENDSHDSDSVRAKTKISPHLMAQLRTEAEGGKRSKVGSSQISAVAESIVIGSEIAELLCLELGLKTEEQEESILDEFRTEVDENASDDDWGEKRFPVVTVMGHVDHGKTTLLDTLRNAKVAESEAGGITQAVAAFKVDMGGDGSEVVFLDTPGHEAFSSMRKCGAVVTDIIVLVIAASDGIRPQTLESIELAKAAGVPIVVALTKVDLNGINKDEALQRISYELSSHGVDTEVVGGDVQIVPVSAVKNEGLDDLTEAVKLQAEMMNLRASANSRGEAVVLESRRERSVGAVADLLVRWGTLKVGDLLVVGEQHGKVRRMLDDTGKPIKTAGPSTPVRLIGLDEPPAPGNDVLVVPNIARAREIVSLRSRRRTDAEAATQEIEEKMKSSEDTQDSEGESDEPKVVTDPVVVPVVLKADTDGSLEALKYSVEAINLEMEQKRSEYEETLRLDDSETDGIDYTILPKGSGFKVISNGVGEITSNDISMAAVAEGAVFGFNVRVAKQMVALASSQGVDVVTQGVIYHLLDDMNGKLREHLPKQEVLEVLGSAEVLQTFVMKGNKRSQGDWVVAGCRVVDGNINSKSRVRVLREGVVIHKSSGIDSLKHFKENVKNVSKGTECGISLSGFEEFQKGDVIEAVG